MSPFEIARVCHEVNRAYCAALGDLSQPPWADAPEWQRKSALNGVAFALCNPVAVAFSGSAYFSLYYPRPTPFPTGDQHQSHAAQPAQNGTSEPRGTQDAPIVVKILPPAPGTPEAAKDEYEREQKSAVERGLLYFTAVLAAGTIGLMVATVGLVAFAKQQAKDTKILQRAYLSVDPLGVEPYRSLDGRLSCDVAFRNSGNLPASNVRWFIDTTYHIDNLLTDLPIDETKLCGSNVIPARGEIRKGSLPLNSAELDAKRAEYRAQDKVGWVYIWGRVTYSDGFQDDRLIDFCHRYSLAGTSWTIDGRHGRQHEFGNRTDEQDDPKGGA